MDDHDEERLLSDEASDIKFLSDADKKVNRKINVSDADKITGTSDADVHAFRAMQDNISRMAQSMNFMSKAWMEIAEQKQAEKRSGGERTPDSLDVQQTSSAKKQKMTGKVTDSPPSAKKQKIFLIQKKKVT